MDYSLKSKSPGTALRPQATTPTSRTSSPSMRSPQVLSGGKPSVGTDLHNKVHGAVNGGILAPKTGGANNTSTTSTSSKKVSSDAEIKEKLVGYVQVDQPQWGRLPTGTHIRYFARGDGQRAARFRTGGFIVSWTKSANGKVYLKIANKLEFTNRQAGYRDFSVDVANVAEIWAKPEVVDKVKNEVSPTELIKQLVEDVAALKLRISALERKK